MLLIALALLAQTPAVRGIPFQITNNKTFVQVAINGSAPQWFILDTGNNSNSVIGQECADRLKLKRSDEESAQIGAGSGVSTGLSHLSQPLHLQTLGETLSVAEPVAFTMRHIASVEGRRVDGLIGADFLARHVIAIDYARHRITIHDPARYTPPPGGLVLPLDLETGWPVIQGTVTTRTGTPLPCRLIVDTGMRGTMILFRPFSERHGLNATARLRDCVLGAGAGGLTRGDITRVDSITLGPAVFKEAIVSFARDKTGIFAVDGPEGIIGGELLRRHRVTFDCPHRRMILEPYAAAATDAFEADMSGLFLMSDPPEFETIRIAWVNPGTPAAEARLRIGDEIISIDGRRSSKLSLDEARNLLRTPVTRRLQIRREGKVKQIRLAARRMV